MFRIIGIVVVVWFGFVILSGLTLMCLGAQ